MTTCIKYRHKKDYHQRCQETERHVYLGFKEIKVYNRGNLVENVHKETKHDVVLKKDEDEAAGLYFMFNP